VKNDFEIKYAERILVSNNIMDGSWQDAQAGFGVLITPRGNIGDHITFKNNIVRNTYQGMQINPADSGLSNVLIENNLFYNIDYTLLNPGRGSGGVMTNWIFRHNTATGTGGSLTFFEGASPMVSGWYVYDNLLTDKDYGILGTGTSRGLPTVQRWATNYDWNNNVIIGGAGTYGTDSHFRGFLYAANNAAVGFTNSALANPADFRLAVSSPYKGKATDGKDIGADIDAILNVASNPSQPVTTSPPLAPTSLVAQ
jgi:hypothetical protein